MDYIRAFDVELDRPVFYAGEMLTGNVYLEAEENMRMQNIKVFLRGKAHAEWKITRAGERRTMKQDEHYIDERILLWGKDENDSHQGIPIITRGRHRYPFHFQLPETALPCSFESKIGNVRYYVRVNLNIPYASCPQCIRYFTIIGPHIDCMDDRFLTPVSSVAKRNSCSLCCGKGPLLLRATMERTSYVCGEQIKLKAEVQNGSDSEVWVLCKLIQYVEFFINKGVLGLSKEVRHTVMEAESDKVPPHDTSRLDELMGRLVVPIMPPTMIEVCGLVQIYYTLKLYLETSKGKGDAAEVSMPITIATVPFRIPNSPMPDIHYESAAPNVEGGMYISPEFQLGQVYMGEEVDPETDQTILYRPVYVCVSDDRPPSHTDAHLLQVPGRQMGRSRENVRGSREGLQSQENITSTHSMQQQMKMFQVAGDESGTSSGKVKPEDKFLKEITAKIANRQGIGEAGARCGVGTADEPAHHIDIDSQVEIMRKQKQSNDIVHKALVSELRRHLSEGEDGMEIEKVPPSLKKPPVSKKPGAPGSIDPSKRMKTDMGTFHEEPASPGSDGGQITEKVKESAEAEISEGLTTIMSQSVEKAEQVVSRKDDNEEEIEYSELSALISASTEDSVQMDTEEKKTARSEIGGAMGRDRSSDYEVSMQQSPERLPPGDVDFTEGEHAQLLGKQEELLTEDKEVIDIVRQLEFEDNAADVSTVKVTASSPGQFRSASPGQFRSASPGRRVDNITPVAIAATVTAAAPMAADPSPVRTYSPKVAPKPKQKDRHSFPAAHPSSAASALEITGLTVETAGRPKSDMIEQSRQDSSNEDSVV